MVKFHFGLGGDDDSTPKDENTSTPPADGAASASDNSTPPATDQPPVTQAPTRDEKKTSEEASEPVIEKVSEPTEKNNPFSIPAAEETKETAPTPQTNGNSNVEPVIPAATESPVLPTENPFANNGKNIATDVTDEKKTDVPKPVMPNTGDNSSSSPTSDAFSPAPAGTLQKTTAPIQDTKKVGGAAPGLEPLTPPVASNTEPSSPIAQKETDNDEKSTSPSPAFGVGNMGGSPVDPAQTLKKVKGEIEGYVKEHKDKIKDYQEQINVLNEKIKEEKASLRKKHDEFADLLKEMNELTRDFENGNGGNSNGQNDKQNYRKPSPRK